MRSKLFLILIFTLLAALPAHQPLRAAVDETPQTVVNSDAYSFTTADPGLYWQTQPRCVSETPAIEEVRILRAKVTGLEPRTVFVRQTELPAGSCTPSSPGQVQAATGKEITTPTQTGYRILSNIIADATHIYWMDASGLVRLPTTANPGDTPEAVLPNLANTTYNELAMDTDRIFGYSDGHLWQVNKANPNGGLAIGYTGPESASQLRYDGEFLYMIWGPNRHLRRYTVEGAVHKIAENVKTYLAMGAQLRFSGVAIKTYKFVYYVPNSATEIIRYDNVNGEYLPVYNNVNRLPPGFNGALTALAPGNRLTLNSLNSIFFFERRTERCGGFVCPAVDYLFRLGSGGGEPGAVYFTNQQGGSLQSSGDFLLWNELPPLTPVAGPIKRLTKDASTLPSINLRVTGMNITQGVQLPDNSIRLIQHRPTFVRLFVKSDGVSVANVSARLTAIWDGAVRETIAPTRRELMVQQYPNKDNLDHGFLFELPAHWTLHNDLRLRGQLNPFGFPLEPTFDDNGAEYGPFHFDPAPDFRMLILRTGYTWDNKDGNPNNDFHRANDLDQIESWLWRAYPLGLRPGSETISFLDYTDDGLGARTRDFNNFDQCQYLFNDKNKNKVVDAGETDDRNLCASYYLHERLLALRNELKLPKDHYIYASVVGLARGSASGNGPVANGPDLSAGAFATAGFYAGHEIGHLLGRGHPKDMSGPYPGCGHSADDPNFPYFFNWIGGYIPDRQVTGFDSRLWVPGAVPRRLMRLFDVREVMGYCNTPDQWLSDYTYNGIYDRLRAQPGPQLAVNAASRLDGDWLTIAGALWPESEQGAITSVRRVASVLGEGVTNEGDYTLQQLSADGGVLASQSFTPTLVSDSEGAQSFYLTMAFAAGATSVQIIHQETGTVIASQSLSPSPPQISLPAIAANTQATADIITLTWEASDPDGDSLIFDVLYSVDGGITFLPLQTGLTATQVAVDSANLPGGDLIFQVVAYDGVNTTAVNSIPFTVAAKPPSPRILQPAEGAQFQYGQPVNLSGYARDLQDGSLSDENTLVWSNQNGVLGVGPQLSISDLPVGQNLITLQATNSLGQSGVYTVTILVGDELAPPPPTLAVDVMSLGWQVAVDTTTVQTATVGISNSGGDGILTWTVTSDVAWLTVDPVTGAVPASFTAFADPAGMAANSNHSGTLTITSTDALGRNQSKIIPVTMQIGAGSIWSPPPLPDNPTGANSQVFLPVVHR